MNEQRQVAYWKEYSERGSSEHAKQIKLLEQELIDMQNSHDEMACMSTFKNQCCLIIPSSVILVSDWGLFTLLGG